MKQPVRILGIAGSLRKASYNRAALRAAAELLPEGCTLDIFDLDGLPGFNEELERDPPPTVVDLKNRILAADAVLFATPEYNYSTPPSLSNALDYLFNEWAYKPAAFVSYGGISGGLRGVQATKLTFTALKLVPMVETVTIPMFGTRIDASGLFRSDDALDAAARSVLTELARWESALRVLRVPQG